MKPQTKIRTLYKQIKELRNKIATAANRRTRNSLRHAIRELEAEIKEIKKDRGNE